MSQTKTNKSSIESLENQLKIARSEIKNVREQVRALKVKEDQKYKNRTGQQSKNIIKPKNDLKEENNGANLGQNLPVKQIGVINSQFPEKRGTPRQATICANTIAKLTLNNEVFTNPDHALEGLREFSHLWLLFYFHKNDSNNVKAKVALPRLNGEKRGVFATRSPHRPSPIGLSLVKIHKIEGNEIYFYGVDVVDGTPVLDIKPYIPQYDNPIKMEEKQIGPVESEAEFEENLIKVPSWIEQSAVDILNVVFEEAVLDQLESLDNQGENLKILIENVLREDPRSVYLRGRWSSGCYKFPVGEIFVSCRFDDVNHVVTVNDIIKNSKVE